MTTTSVRSSAKIYEFPPRRGAMQADPKAGGSDEPRMTTCVIGSGWYHEAALREAEPARKR